MSEEIKGTQKMLSKLIGHQIIFIPCQAYRTNTFLEHSCEVSLVVSNLIDDLESLYVFFSDSSKRFAHLNNLISKVEAVFKIYQKPDGLPWMKA